MGEEKRAEEDYVELRVFDKKLLYVIPLFLVFSFANLCREAGHFDGVELPVRRILLYLELPVLLIAFYYMLRGWKKVRLRKLLEWEVGYMDVLRLHLLRSIIFAGVFAVILSSPYMWSPNYFWLLFLLFSVLSGLLLFLLPTRFVITPRGVSAGSSRGYRDIIGWDGFKSFSVDEREGLIKLHRGLFFMPSQILVAGDKFREARDIIAEYVEFEG